MSWGFYPHEMLNATSWSGSGLMGLAKLPGKHYCKLAASLDLSLNVLLPLGYHPPHGPPQNPAKMRAMPLSLLAPFIIKIHNLGDALRKWELPILSLTGLKGVTRLGNGICQQPGSVWKRTTSPNKDRWSRGTQNTPEQLSD